MFYLLVTGSSFKAVNICYLNKVIATLKKKQIEQHEEAEKGHVDCFPPEPKSESGQMIACDNLNCNSPNEWYHC